jgi:hypothetical protein
LVWGFEKGCLLKKHCMARIFSIRFLYEGAEHHAMISVRTTPLFAEYSIAMLDETIAAHLPNSKIISTSKSSFAFSDSTMANSPALMQAIIKAITSRVQTVDA